jgi:hypothetical protein
MNYSRPLSNFERVEPLFWWVVPKIHSMYVENDFFFVKCKKDEMKEERKGKLIRGLQFHPARAVFQWVLSVMTVWSRLNSCGTHILNNELMNGGDK